MLDKQLKKLADAAGLADWVLVQPLLEKHLSRIQLQIISDRYGLTDGREKSLAAVGRPYNMRSDAVRQIEAKVFEILKTKTL